MQSLIKYTKGIKYLLCAVNLFSKYAWVVSLKDKRGITIISQGCKPNKWVDQGGEFYNEMYLTYNEGKSVAAERFIRMLKNKIFKHMAAISKNVYLNVLHNIVNKYNNKVHRTIKMKTIDVTSDSYAEYKEHSNEKDPTFKIDDHVRISKYKNIFAKGYTQNWSKEIFTISKIKDTFPWTYVISDLNGELITGSFYKKELQKNESRKIQNRKSTWKKR